MRLAVVFAVPLFLAFTVADKGPAYGQLNQVYQQQKKEAAESWRLCINMFENAKYEFIVDKLVSSSRRLAVLSNGRLVGVSSISKGSDKPPACWFSSPVFPVAFTTVAAETPLYLNKQLSLPKGEKILVVQEGGNMYIYFKLCSTCSVLKELLARPRP